MARNADKTPGNTPGTDPDTKKADGPDDDAELGPVVPDEIEPEADGYKPTRRQVARGDKPSPKSKPGPAAPPPTKYQQFMEQHWEGWLSQVLLLALAGAGVLAYQLKLLPEAKLGLVLAGGLVAVTIYATAIPAHDLIKSATGRRLFTALVVIWAIAAGYPTLRKGMSRKVLAETTLTEQVKTAKLPIAEGQTGPYDVTVSGTMKQEAGQNTNLGYELVVTGEGNASTEISGEFTYSVHQARVRRGSTHWSEQHDQLEHRLPSTIHGKELTITTERVDDMLQDGLHVTVHPSSYDPNWFFLAGIFVVLGMIYAETKIGDSKNKTHLVMAAAATLVFSYQYHHNATASRMVMPAFDALLLAAVTGAIGGTIVGAIARRVSGRDRLKPAIEDDDKSSEKT